MYKRQPITFVNKTNYFNPDLSKSRITVSSPSSYNFRYNKQKNYYVRLYWEFRNCVDHCGQVFYYTLTYNDNSLPKFEGIPCFDYKDLEYFFSGGFRKILLRKYGSTLKYFVGAELGEGKGKRGMDSNPHYHVLFFIYDAHSSKYPYIKITPLKLRSIIRYYWQGFDQDFDGYKDFRSARYGICKEGENVGLVKDFRAVSYVCKYVTKDLSIIQAEKRLKKILFYKYYPDLYQSSEVHNLFLNELYLRLLPGDDLPLPGTEFSCLCKLNAPLLYKTYTFLLNSTIHEHFDEFISEAHLVSSYTSFVLNLVEDHIRLDLNIYRNRYSNKCRLSHGVGLYALDFFDEKSLSVPIPTKNGFENRKIGLYYYRKLYYKVVKDDNGNNIYILNQRGIDMKVSTLERSVNCLSDRLNSYLSILSESVFNDIKSIGLVSSVVCSYDTFLKNYDLLSKYYTHFNLTKHYAIYKLVYEGRSFKINRDGLGNIIYPSLNYLADYKKFLEPSYFSCDYNPSGVIDFLKTDNKIYSSYTDHKDFSPFLLLFNVFDLLLNYFFVCSDKQIEDKIEEIKKVKKFHDSFKLKQYYSSFKF